MSAHPVVNLSCGRCHTSADQLNRPLLKCAGCYTVQYCDTDCQRADWPRHKVQCKQWRDNAQPTPRTRTVTRMSFAQLQAMTGSRQASDPDGTIYYLKTSQPHILDISISGPYNDLDQVYHQARHNFGDDCEPGRHALEELKSGGQPAAFTHISSPIKGDPNKIRRIELIKKTNPSVAARLPCRVWNVILMKMIMSDVPESHRGPTVPVRDGGIVGTCLSENAAKDAVQRCAEEMTREVPSRRFVTIPVPGAGFAMGCKEGDAMLMLNVVEDNGSVV